MARNLALATTSPSSTPSVVQPLPAQSAVSPALTQTTAAGLFKKPGSPRKRRRTLEGAESAESAETSLEGQVKTKLGITSPPAAVELTGAGEVAEQKRRRMGQRTPQIDNQAGDGISVGPGAEQSANPRQQALSALRDVNSQAMSTLADAPQPTVSVTVLAGDANTPAGSVMTSPVSNTSVNTTTSLGASVPQMASPTQMEADGSPGEDRISNSALGVLQTSSPKSYSYPGPRPSELQSSHARRDMSLPGAQMNDDSKASGGGKKHKCPHCDTEFTRHHNLKSHLLTHSQEKPFLCDKCDLRFRRLHDLKRHQKLHTGERPHICKVCKRKFARGDALARHTKGAGGCAGHRPSIGSIGGDAGEGEMVIDSLMYTGEPAEMDESDGPLRGRNGSYQSPPSNSQSQAPQTYPPVNRSQYLLPGSHGNGVSSSPHTNSNYAQRGQPSYPPASASYGHSSITESPAPISPSSTHPSGGHDPRRHSLGQQLNPFGRSNTQDRTSPQSGANGPAPTATMGLPPPQSTSHSGAAPFTQLPPPLPPISTTGGAIGGGSHVGGPNAFAAGPGSGSTHNSLSSHGQSSGERGTLGIDDRDRLWAIINALETQLAQVRERQDAMERELVSLKQSPAEK